MNSNNSLKWLVILVVVFPVILVILGASIVLRALLIMVCWGVVASWIDILTISYVQALLISLMLSAIAAPGGAAKGALDSILKILKEA